MTTIATYVVRWIGLLLTLPFALRSLFKQDPNMNETFHSNARCKLPKFILGFCGVFRHLTMVSFMMNCMFWAVELLRDYGLLASAGRWLDSIFPSVLTIAMFVACVFWALLSIHTSLLLDPADLFPDEEHQSQPWFPVIGFQLAFGPPIKGHEWGMNLFKYFQIYLHTVIPLLMVADAILGQHPIFAWDVELARVLATMVVYLAWNLSAWGLLRMAPYPVQKKLYQRGMCLRLVVYAVLFSVAVALWFYSRALRRVTDWRSFAYASPVILMVLWASCGFFPFKKQLARCQGLDVKSIWIPEGSLNDQNTGPEEALEPELAPESAAGVKMRSNSGDASEAGSSRRGRSAS